MASVYDSSDDDSKATDSSLEDKNGTENEELSGPKIIGKSAINIDTTLTGGKDPHVTATRTHPLIAIPMNVDKTTPMNSCSTSSLPSAILKGISSAITAPRIAHPGGDAPMDSGDSFPTNTVKESQPSTMIPIGIICSFKLALSLLIIFFCNRYQWSSHAKYYFCSC